jgi:hypothetical protein
MGHDALGTAENESRCAKHKNVTRRPRYRRKRLSELKTLKWDSTPPKPSKMCPGAQNKKTGNVDLRTVEYKFGSAKHENRTIHPRYCRKRVGARKT